MLSMVILVLLSLGIFSVPLASESPRFSGTEPLEIKLPSQRERIQEIRQSENQWTEILSWEPRAFLYHNFLSKLECEYLINRAKPQMKQFSANLKHYSAKYYNRTARTRTISGTFLQRGSDDIISAIDKRIADFSFIPSEHSEDLQVLHYEVGQRSAPHFDYFLDRSNTKNGGQRIATMVMYLSDVDEGGETIFPNAKVNSSSLPYYDELSECGKKGLAVKPKLGNALLFWNVRPDATRDPSSLNGECPVVKGNKWSSTKWMHVGEYH